MLKDLNQPSFTAQEKSEAVAVALMSRSQREACEIITEMWGREGPRPNTLNRWVSDVTITPDPTVVALIERERIGQLRSRLHAAFTGMADRLIEETKDMSWRDAQHAMIAIGIAFDKIHGREGGQRVVINDNRKVVIPFSEKIVELSEPVVTDVGA